MKKKELARIGRHRRIRRKVVGTKERPRLSVSRSHRNLCIQLIDDITEKTLLSFSTLDKSFRKTTSNGGNKKAAGVLAQAIVTKMKTKGIEVIVFDRSGYKYHGRIRAFAEELRKQGIKF